MRVVRYSLVHMNIGCGGGRLCELWDWRHCVVEMSAGASMGWRECQGWPHQGGCINMTGSTSFVRSKDRCFANIWDGLTEARGRR